MPTIEELLRTSLKGANDKFDQANKALHATVAEAAKAVEAVTQGKVTLRLDEVRSNEFETGYDLRVVPTTGGETRRLSGFAVTKKGFPIQGELYNEKTRASFDSSETLTQYFHKLASDPDSPLVGYIAYIVRNSGDNPIPF